MPLARCLVVAAGLMVALSVAAPSHAGDKPLREIIEGHIAAAWAEQGIDPAPLAGDAAFLRRVHLDLTGTIPSHDEARAFLDDADSDKRARLIDRLLDSPGYAQHQADVWDMVLFGRHPPGYDADKRPGFQSWLRDQFAANRPWDEMVRAILEAEGNTVEHGAPAFLVQYRRKPEDAVQAIVQKFLGVQLQCARCHDHPYERWSQLDFYGMAAFLARLDVVEVGKKGKLKKLVVAEKSVGEIEFSGPAAEQEAGKDGVPVPAKFLHGDVLEEPPPPEGFEQVKFKNGKTPPAPHFSRKDRLAAWVTAADNTYFARAVANRVWAQFMGKGIIHPVDDMGERSRASHPELLEALAANLVEHDFDLRWLIREICNARPYQLAATGPIEAARPRWYERAKVRPLSAEELAAAWRTATGYVAAEEKAAEKIQDNRYDPIAAGYMMRFFGEPANGEGDFQGGLLEHLFMNNGGIDKLFTREPGGLFHTLLESDQPWEERVDRLFLAVLSRRPDPEERQRFAAFLTAEQRPDDRLKDAVWTLMTCSEFRFNH